MQQRLPPQNTRQRQRSRLASATGSLIGGASPAVGTMSPLAAEPRLPPRTTKVSQKLVLLPETEGGGREKEEEEIGQEGVGELRQQRQEGGAVLVDEEQVQRLAKERGVDPDVIRKSLLSSKDRRKLHGDFAVDNDVAPLLAEEELLRRRRVRPEKAKSYAERLPKARRAEKVARVTAYCTAQAYKMSSVASFVKEWHGARVKFYDDCLYTAYQLPLLPGHEGYRLRSSPTVKYPGGKSFLDEEIERNELRDHHEDYMVEALEHSVGGGRVEQTHPGTDSRHSTMEDHHQSTENRNAIPTEHPRPHHHRHYPTPPQISSPSVLSTPPAPAGIPAKFLSVAEMFVFSYGVVVFWNFTEPQEKDLLADLAFATSSVTGTPVPLATLPLHEEDFETEEFHFEYSTEISHPRVYNDMITLRSGDHMIKLAISHGIAQSTKLCFFEEVMARQMAEAKDIPRRLATTGQLGMKREELFRILGKLFKSRVEVNLSSNVLDVPNFFWESEPTLYPLYIAVREYLEIKPRIQVLNERCRVFLDLTEILSDSIADNKTSNQTWVCIFLIVLSIFVTIFEVILRFGLLSTRQSGSSSLHATAFSNMMHRAFSSSSSAGACVCPGMEGGDLNGSVYH
ncbi:hypothetical protein MAP00_003582 [Monascus purpureus]|nr:hypothetical protein MAP00_003582 [Monascus purpureus]